MNINATIAIRNARHAAAEAAIIASALPAGAYHMDGDTMRGPATWVFTDADQANLVFELKGTNDE